MLPHRFVKIRHFGLMASGNATTKLELARARLSARKLPSTLGRPCLAEATIPKTTLLEHLLARACPVCASVAFVRRALPDARAPPACA